jgi:hypothetical protein
VGKAREKREKRGLSDGYSVLVRMLLVPNVLNAISRERFLVREILCPDCFWLESNFTH